VDSGPEPLFLGLENLSTYQYTSRQPDVCSPTLPFPVHSALYSPRHRDVAFNIGRTDWRPRKDCRVSLLLENIKRLDSRPTSTFQMTTSSGSTDVGSVRRSFKESARNKVPGNLELKRASVVSAIAITQDLEDAQGIARFDLDEQQPLCHEELELRNDQRSTGTKRRRRKRRRGQGPAPAATKFEV